MRSFQLIIFFILLFVSNQIKAALITLDFESLQGTGTNFGSFEYYGNTIDINGFRFFTTAGLGGFISYLPSFPLYSGAIALIPNQTHALTTLTRIDATPFEIANISLAFSNLAQPGNASLTFIGTKSDTSEIQTTFSISNTTTQFSFSGFSDLTSLRWSQSTQDANNHRFNNFTIENNQVAIPTTGTLGLLFIAFIALFNSRKTKSYT